MQKYNAPIATPAQISPTLTFRITLSSKKNTTRHIGIPNEVTKAAKNKNIIDDETTDTRYIKSVNAVIIKNTAHKLFTSVVLKPNFNDGSRFAFKSDQSVIFSSREEACFCCC